MPTRQNLAATLRRLLRRTSTSLRRTRHDLADVRLVAAYRRSDVATGSKSHDTVMLGFFRSEAFAEDL